MEHVEIIKVGTPLTQEYYLNTPGGSIYSADHTLERFRPENLVKSRPETSIPNLTQVKLNLIIWTYIPFICCLGWPRYFNMRSSINDHKWNVSCWPCTWTQSSYRSWNYKKNTLSNKYLWIIEPFFWSWFRPSLFQTRENK